MSTILAPETVLFQRHVAYAERRDRLLRACGPALTPALDWTDLWRQVNDCLRQCGYAQSTRRQYRQVLRALRRAGMKRPADVTPQSAHRFICGLSDSRFSWSWTALHITVLRTVFDRLCGIPVARELATPRRPDRLPEIINEKEAEHLVRAGGTIRDQLLLGLLYGCGLTGSEAVALRWRDVVHRGARLHIEGSTRNMERVQPVPEALQDLLRAGVETCEPDDFIFRGRTEGRHLSTRMVEIVVRRACDRAQIPKPVCVSTLRHSYAVQRLENGVSLPRLQRELGHASIRTTERYRRCLAPRIENHPLRKVRALMGCSDETPAAESRRPSAARKGTGPLGSLRSIDLRNLRLPFQAPEDAGAAIVFFRLLKTRLLGGILRRPG
jgi:site-specific recombinase XerD